MALLLKRNTRASQIKCAQLLLCRALGASTAPPEHYDIIIGGGGLVGTTLAAALTKHDALKNSRILLLEGAPAPKKFDPVGQYGNRVSAINKRTIELFKSIGVWETISSSRIAPVKQMQVWDASSDASIQFQHDHFASDVACIVENDLILDAVYSLLQNSNTENVHIRNKARIDCVRLPQETGTGKSEITLKDCDDTYTCDLLIGADGANSVIRREMGVDVYSYNYESLGVVATLKLSDTGNSNNVAWQRFIPTGPIALLPLTDDMSSLVWSTTIPHAQQLMTLKDEDFINAVNEAFCRESNKNDLAVKAVNALNSIMGRSGAQMCQYPPRVSGVIEKSRASFPLGFLHASSYVCTGAALVGDAAHRIHPMAGQGVNLGFSDVGHLVDVLGEASYAGFKFGDQHHLIKYEQRSLLSNVPILIGVHGLQSLYSTEFSPVVLLRGLGLQFTQNIPIIKNMFMKRAMG